MKQQKLTKRQEAIYLHVEKTIAKRGYGPSIRELMRHFDISSPNGVQGHLRLLIKKGWLKRSKDGYRMLVICKNSP